MVSACSVWSWGTTALIPELGSRTVYLGEAVLMGIGLFPLALRIAEIPQMINIRKRDMSFVGPWLEADTMKKIAPAFSSRWV